MPEKSEVGSPEWWDTWKGILENKPAIQGTCQMDVVKLSQLKSQNQTFYSKFYLTVIISGTEVDLGEQADCEMFDPLVMFESGFGALKIEKGATAEDGLYKYFYKVEGMFEDDFELKLFPFDLQEMAIILTSQWDNSFFVLVEGTDKASTVDLKLNRTIEGLFKLDEYIHFKSTEVTSVTNKSYTHLYALVLMQRVWYPYIVTLWLRQFVVTTLAFSSFTIALSGEPSRDRLTVVIGLLLTSSLGFKKDEGVVTWLDAYVMAAFLTLSVILAYHGIGVAVVISDDIDTFIFVALLVLWVAINIIFWAVAIVQLFNLGKRFDSWRDKTNDTFRLIGSAVVTATLPREKGNTAK